MYKRSAYSYLESLDQNTFGAENAAFAKLGTYEAFCEDLERKFNITLCMIIRMTPGVIFHISAPNNGHIMEAKNEQQAKLIARNCIERICVDNNVVINCVYEIVFTKTDKNFTKIRIN